LQEAAKKAIAAFDVLKGEARALKESAEEIAPYDDNELHAKLQELPEDSASVEAILDAERKEASRIHEDRGLQKRVEGLQKKRDVLKEKVDGMQGADDARNAELSKLRGPWEKTLRDALSSLKTKFSDYMDTLGVRISASRRVETPSFHSNDSCPSHDEVGGFFFYFEAIRTASSDRDAPRRRGAMWSSSSSRRSRGGAWRLRWLFEMLVTCGNWMLACSRAVSEVFLRSCS